MQQYPVDTIVSQLGKALTEHRRAILSASPGSGKTTRVPLALLGLLPKQPCHEPLPGKILVLEPRRLAARAAARYMAGLLGEAVGQRVGYRVRLESRVSERTRVELLTEGMFTRTLLADPELSGVSCVIFDEFHERSLQADLGLALCLESAAVLRPDLRLLIMSATLATGDLSRFLGDCPVIEAPGRTWPVSTVYAGRALQVAPGAGLEATAVKCAQAVRQCLAAEPGNVLVFLPGQGEIRRCCELLENRPADSEIFPLYGDLSPAEQDRAIAPPAAEKRKVVLATDLAQTSLTIEGVRMVVDAGLARGSRFDPATGLSRLVTSRLSRDAADQRAGRAGRLEPGFCLRLWDEGESLAPQVRPEILDADLASLCLDVLVWGGDVASLPWLTLPPEAALRHAWETLLLLDAVQPLPQGRYGLTEHGRKLARLPLHPRLAHMVLGAAAQEADLSSLACALAAIISERDPLRGGGESRSDVRLRLPLLRQAGQGRLRDAAAQIHRLSGLPGSFRLPDSSQECFCGALLSLAWPERIAQRRALGSFRLASGQGAELPGHDSLATEDWLVTVSLGNGVNRRIHLAAPLTLEELLRLHGKRAERCEEVFWDSRSEAVISRGILRLGALILEEKVLPPVGSGQERVARAMLEGILSLGLACLPWDDELRQLQARVQMLGALEKAGKLWPDLSDEALEEDIRQAVVSGQTCWLSPWLGGISRRAHVSGLKLSAALAALLPWPLPGKLEKEAPVRLPLPSGTWAGVDYLPVLRGEPPVLAVKLQEMFGQTDTPCLAGGRVPVMLHLLSPAGRPLQVTGDLQHFWQNGYKQVRAEMRGRYPKHPWPEDPLTAIPTGKTKKRLERSG